MGMLSGEVAMFSKPVNVASEAVMLVAATIIALHVPILQVVAYIFFATITLIILGIALWANNKLYFHGQEADFWEVMDLIHLSKDQHVKPKFFRKFITLAFLVVTLALLLIARTPVGLFLAILWALDFVLAMAAAGEIKKWRRELGVIT